MKHSIPLDTLGPRGEAMTAPIEACVHCGFCLPTCPTYVTLGEEMDSPRGRIFLMKEVLEGKLELEESLPYLDNCLGCESCVSACPSGVEYGDLITSFRAHAEPQRSRPPLEKAERVLAHRTLSHPSRMRAAIRFGGVARAVSRLLPTSARAMIGLLPEELPKPEVNSGVVPALGTRRARVALLSGCAQQAMNPGINAAAVRVLSRNGVEVVMPPGQGCCGSLAFHDGEAKLARSLARKNLRAFPDDVDAIITTTAGCGSGMKEYGLLFAGDEDHEAAEHFAERVSDISTFLAGLGLAEPPPALRAPLRVAYQDACHLAHAQGERSAPRALLESVEGLELVQADEWELCCGSAGTYNVQRPEIAAQLGERKARNLVATEPDLVVSGNIGCMTQLRPHLDRVGGAAAPILHTIEVLDRAYSQTLTKEAMTG